MKRIISMLIATVMIISLISATATAAEGSGLPFKDVKSGAWYYDAVETSYNAGVIKGITENEFQPNKNMTRAELVTLLYRLAEAEDAEECKSAVNFKDVKSNAWYAGYVGWAVKNKLVSGYEDNTFGPNKNITRQEIAKLFATFLDFLGADTSGQSASVSSFSDKSTFPSWSAEYIEQIRKTGLIAGDDKGRYNPKNNATRAEIAMIVSRYLLNIHDEMYVATTKISELYCPNHSGRMHYMCCNDTVSFSKLTALILEKLGLEQSVYDIKYTINEEIYESLMYTDYHNYQSPGIVVLKINFVNRETGAVGKTCTLKVFITINTNLTDSTISLCTKDMADETMEYTFNNMAETSNTDENGVVRVPYNVLDGDFNKFEDYMIDDIFCLSFNFDSSYNYKNHFYGVVMTDEDYGRIASLADGGGTVTVKTALTNNDISHTTESKDITYRVYSREQCLEYFNNLYDEMTAKMGELGSLIEQCELSGIPTDYEDAAITVMEKTVYEHITDIITGNNTDYTRLSYYENHLNNLYKTAKENLEGYLDGTKEINNVTSYVTSKVTQKGFTQTATTVDSFGNEEEKVVYFYGFGDGNDYMLSNMDSFDEMGLNAAHYYELDISDVIREPLPGETEGLSADGKYVIDTSGLVARLNMLNICAENNIAVCLMLCRALDSEYIFDTYPELGFDSDAEAVGMINFNINSEAGRMIVEDYLRAVLPIISQYKYISSFVLSNEPSFMASGFGDYYKPQWTEFLKEMYGTTDKMNKAYGTSYKTFDEVPLAMRSDIFKCDRYSYDSQLFNQKQHAEWHAFMTEICHEICPDIPVTTKLKSTTLDRGQRVMGFTPEDFSEFLDVAGCDDVKDEIFFYDQIAYANESLVVDSEVHLLEGPGTWFTEESDSWIYNTIWRGFVHHLGMGTIWSYDNQIQRCVGSQMPDGRYVYRPETLYNAGKVTMDANRLSDELSAIVNNEETVAVLDSYVSRQFNVNETQEVTEEVYNAMLYCGERVRIVSDKQISKINNCRLLVVPYDTNVTKEVLEEILKFGRNGGKIIIVGYNSLKYDDFGNKQDEGIVNEIYNMSTVIGIKAGYGEYKKYFEEYLSENGLQRVWLCDADTGEVVGGDTEWQWTEYGGGIILTAYSIGRNYPENVSVYIDGKLVEASKELINNEYYTSVFKMERYTPILLQIGGEDTALYGKAVEGKTFGDFTYTVNGDGAEITGYRGEDKNVTVPDNIEGTTVTSIGAYAFAANESIESVTLPSTLKALGEGAFSGCTSLVTVKGLENTSVSEIGSCTFNTCSSLENIKLNDKTVTVGYYAFKECRSLETITLPESVDVIMAQAFRDCSGLKTIVMPKKMSYIGTMAFRNCTSLSGSFTVPEGVEVIFFYTFQNCKSVSEFILPDTVTTVGERAFSGCFGVKRAYFPGSVKIYKHAALEGFGSGIIIHFGEGTQTLGMQLTGSAVEIPASVTYIDDRAYYEKIYCKAGTYAERFAKENGYKYEIVD